MRALVIACAAGASCGHVAERAPLPGPLAPVCALVAARPPPPAPGECVAAAAPPEDRSFGGAWPGALAWVSADGRWALAWQFRSDDDGDDRVAPRFGQHGEPLGDQPRLYLFDIDAAREDAWDALLDADRDGRAVLLARAHHPWLIEAGGARTDLSTLGADIALNPHSLTGYRALAAFDADGDRVGFVRAGPDRGVVRELASCGEDELPAEAPLWRVHPSVVRGWATLLEVPADSNGDGYVTFPLDRNLRFAASSGAPDRASDEARAVLASTRGARQVTDEERWPLSPELVFAPRTGRLLDGNGRELALPAGCDRVLAVEGVARVVVRCGDHGALWSPGAAPLALPVAIIALAGRPRRDATGLPWVAARTDGGWGRLALGDGRWAPLGTGPAAEPRAGWITIADGATTAVVHVASGWRTVLHEQAAEVAAFAARLAGGWVAIAPAECRFVAVPRRPLAVASNGCAFTAAAKDGPLERGPWTRRCARR